MHGLLARFRVSPLNSLLVTFGFTVIIESLIQWIWTADYRRLESGYGDDQVPHRHAVRFPSRAAHAGDRDALSLSVWAVLRYTDLGKAMRAAAEDAPIAAAFGVNEQLLFAALRALRRFAAVAGRAWR